MANKYNPKSKEEFAAYAAAMDEANAAFAKKPKKATAKKAETATPAKKKTGKK